MRSTCLVFVLSLPAVLASASDNWPQFRGPGADGRSDATGLPSTWSETENVAWKVPIHDRGWSSPVVFGRQVWVTTATEDGKQMYAVCLDRDSGKTVHDVKVFDVQQPEHISTINSYASPTPVIEAGRVYVHYGTYGTACLDTQSGRILWTRRDLNCDHHEGPGSSPILCGDLLIVNVDGRDVQYVIALDKATGKTAWKTNRSIDYSPYNRNERKAFTTPIVIQSGGRQQLVSVGAKGAMAYDPLTGEELWKVRYNGWSAAPRPLFGHGLVFLVTDYERPELWAVRPGGRGDLAAGNVVWKIVKGVAAQPSPVLAGDLLYMVNDAGIAVAIEPATGQIVWRERLGGNYSASPIYADGRLWFFNQQAATTVIEPGRTCKILSVNRLDGQLMASPAVAGKAFFLRTRTHLYRIEDRSASLGQAGGTVGRFPGIAPTLAEMCLARRWTAAKFEDPAKQPPSVAKDAAVTADPPFSFVYGGRPSAELLKTWTVERTSRELDALRSEHTIVYRDPATGLAIRCVAVEYHDFPSVEWTLHIKNTGTADTPLLTDIQAIDTTFHRTPDGEFILHHSTGSPCSANDYEPHATPLGPKAAKRITTSGGRSTNSDMPYFNLQWPGQGVIVVLGWPGQWAAEFSRDEGTGLRVRGGQELTRFKLHAGEEVRTPLAVVQFWQGDWIRSQNLWRRWMLAHNLPRPGGKPMPPALMNCTSDFYPGMKSNAADEIKYVAAYVDAGVKLDYWWIDAGWYPCRDDWGNVGTWEPDPVRNPKGLKEVADFVHSKGMKLVVWFEPQRVSAGTWLTEHHPEWILGSILNFGHPQARDWMIEHVDKLISGQGIDLYREDHNIDPLGFWRGNDAPDRQGITEIRHVEGHLAYWDELRRRHPQMPIDTCASGGRRNDLETLRRALPLLRSDYRFEPVGTQGHTYGMALWIPYYGTGVYAGNDYVVRSHWCPWLGIGQPDPRKPGQDWTTYHRQIGQLRKVMDYFSGDYYPLTPYSLDNSVWMAWQFDRPEIGEGVVQVFCRTESPYESARFRLRGLEAGARYVVTDLDSGTSQEITGGELGGSGLKVTATERPRAIVRLYRRL